MRHLALSLAVWASCCCWAGAQAATRETRTCPGGDPESINRSFGRVWNVPDQRGIGFDESKEIAKGVTKYYACLAYQQGRTEVCEQLESLKMGPGFFAPNMCQDDLKKLAFVGLAEFISGRGEDRGATHWYYRLFFSHTKMNEKEAAQTVAAAAKKGGFAAVCSAGPRAGSNPEEGLAECRRWFPTVPGDCGADGECRARLAVSKAIASGDSKSCPAAYRTFCEIAAVREIGCEPAAKNLQTTYCTSYRKAEKRLHGQVGLTNEALQENDQINRGIRPGSRKGKAGGSASPAEPSGDAGGESQ
jgi:hypothetical protein